MSALGNDPINEAMLHRVYSEFLEMPGLRLTTKQAQRLWGLDEHTCTKLLNFLVDAKFLCQPGHGAYSRLSEGHSAYRPPQMAKALLNDPQTRKKAG